ncbi:MAG: site-specific integrase, partial [Actinomycetia bacterium]|nr:site-specific integrase [Actinomycetes bacterium]
MKVISETLGHARSAFTADTYTSIIPELAQQAAEATAAMVPRRSGPLSAPKRQPAAPSTDLASRKPLVRSGGWEI